MSKRPEPVMACAECGPVITKPVVKCPLCGNWDVWWADLATGLEWLSDQRHEGCPDETRLLTDAATRLREQDAQIESMQQAQGGTKERRQGLKAARLATVIQERYSDPVTVIPTLMTWQWIDLTDVVNERYGAKHDPPSDDTKALVAQKFAQPQEAPRV